MVMYKQCMRNVNIADLKSHLSRYLAEVRAGAEILVRDRNTPIAKLIPLTSPDDLDAEERALIAHGQLRPPEQPLPKSFFQLPGPRISRRRAVSAVLADRDDD
jgi:prevent-host-death family protein